MHGKKTLKLVRKLPFIICSILRALKVRRMNSLWLLQFVLNKVVSDIESVMSILHRKPSKFDKVLDFKRLFLVYSEFYT